MKIALAIVASLLLGTCSRPPTVLEQILRAGELRVVTRNLPSAYYLGASGPLGPEFELASRFAAELGVRLYIYSVPNVADAIRELGSRRAHIAAANITGYPTDGAETDTGWTFTGFRKTIGTEEKLYNHYYVAEYRTYKGYDYSLKVGPYYFGYTEKPNFADRFAYQDGLLLNYWDTSQADNNTGLHPGQGLLLTIDAHPQALTRCGGPAIWRNRIQAYDSTFTLAPTDGIPNIHHNSVLCPVPSLPAVKVFDDRKTWYDPTNPLGSGITPNTGTIIELRSISALDGFMQVQVRPFRLHRRPTPIPLGPDHRGRVGSWRSH